MTVQCYFTIIRQNIFQKSSVRGAWWNNECILVTEKEKITQKKIKFSFMNPLQFTTQSTSINHRPWVRIIMRIRTSNQKHKEHKRFCEKKIEWKKSLRDLRSKVWKQLRTQGPNEWRKKWEINGGIVDTFPVIKKTNCNWFHFFLPPVCY